MLCHHLILHGMLINVHGTPIKPPVGMALVNNKTHISVEDEQSLALTHNLDETYLFNNECA